MSTIATPPSVEAAEAAASATRTTQGPNTTATATAAQPATPPNKMTRRAAFELLAERALLEGNEELNMAFLLSHKHLLRSHPSRVLLELWIKQYPLPPPPLPLWRNVCFFPSFLDRWVPL